jgi:type I site-specific restriction endonuclease
MDKKQLSERDICTKYITPAIVASGWEQHQFREEVNLTDGRVIVRGNMASRLKLLAKYVRLLNDISKTRAELKTQLQETITR